MKPLKYLLLLMALLMLVPLVCAGAEGQLPAGGEGAVTVRAVGAYIECIYDDIGKLSAMSYDTPVKLKVTADIPRGKALDYWVIDGVRYDFKPKAPQSFTMYGGSEDMLIEAVCKRQESRTLLSAEQIAERRTGEPLTVSAVHARLAHVRRDMTAGGGWMDSFDFTEDYVNRATKKREPGGQVSVRVKATVPKGKKLNYWKFDDARFDLGRQATEIVVRGLNVSRTYEAVLTGTVASGEIQYFTVNCSGCTFSGGGYSNASSGTVQSGTQITVRSSSGVSRWSVNGSTLMATVTEDDGTKVSQPLTASTITRKIQRNTAILCMSDE